MLLKEPAFSAVVTNARTYLNESIDLDPDQSVDEYTEVASSLHQIGAFDEAARIFELLVKRFADAPAYEDAVRDGRRWAALCYRDAGGMLDASKRFEALINDFPRWMVVRRDVAVCYESDVLKRYADAEKQWRVVEDNYEMGGPEWFEARFHRIRNLAYQNRNDLAYQMLAAIAVPYPNLGGEPWEKQFLALVRDTFTEEQMRQFEVLRNEVHVEE